MEQELIDEKLYNEMIENQAAILQEIENNNLMLSNANQLSNKFIGEAFQHFKHGIQAIARIRSNLDEIHKSLGVISKSKKISNS